MDELLTDEQIAEVADSLAYYAKHGENMYASVRVPILRRLLNERERLKAENKTLRRIPKGETWVWQGDGSDFPESLGCPVIMEPDVLRGMLADKERLLAACKRFVEVNRKLGYDFDTNEPEVFSDIVEAILAADKTAAVQERRRDMGTRADVANANPPSEQA